MPAQHATRELKHIGIWGVGEIVEGRAHLADISKNVGLRRRVVEFLVIGCGGMEHLSARHQARW
jgi:hypothetical protein